MTEVCHSLFTFLSGPKAIKGWRTDTEERAVFEEKKAKKLEKPEKKPTAFIPSLFMT